MLKITPAFTASIQRLLTARFRLLLAARTYRLSNSSSADWSCLHGSSARDPAIGCSRRVGPMLVTGNSRHSGRTLKPHPKPGANVSPHRADGTQHDSRIVDIIKTLEQRYGNPRHGNQEDPLDELVFIILSTRTQERTFEQTYRALKARFPSWDSITEVNEHEIGQILAPAGLGHLKARQITAIIQNLRAIFGSATLEPLREWPDAEVEQFLTSLPGVAAKVAKCVMMYSFGRQVLPVDVHVHRIASRLGLRTKKRPDTSQELIESVVPLSLRYSFHVTAVAHGREVCLPRSPRCEICPLIEWCNYYRTLREPQQ